MPSKLPHPCSHPGCPALVTDGRFCPVHQRAVRQAEDERRGSARERGYDRRWEKVRQMKLAHDPLCERCLQAGRVTPATMVHHVRPIRQGGEVLDMANLLSVCRRCHDELHSK
ncbi:MAG TPA: HNH endonuclease [Firmicutes bacterium]|nr:HNH endonuclease [Bacillota bacterium]